MIARERVTELLADGRELRPVEEGIYSTFATPEGPHPWDSRAAGYDLTVGSNWCNRLVLGNSTQDYATFAQRAIGSAQEGWVLDAGGGSLLFSAEAHVVSGRPTVVFDVSLVMLRRARKRLVDLAGRMPEHVSLLQGDLLDIPFRSATFRTVLCLGVIHHFEEPEPLVRELDALLTSGGQLFLTSLILSERRLTAGYLRLLHRGGVLVRLWDAVEVRELLETALGRSPHFATMGSMAYVYTTGDRSAPSVQAGLKE